MSDNVLYAQLQPFRQAGAGSAFGATSIVLNTFTQINGTPLTMANFGLIGYITLEPGSGTQEESAVFTGVVQNANGSATLTGVSRVLTVSPYTQTSGLALAHAGGTTVIVSNTAAFYDSLTDKSDDETITGTWTFTAPNYPQIDVATTLPTADAQFATKKYVDGVAVAGAPNAAPTVKGIVQLATSAETQAGTNVGGTGASLVALPSDIAANTQKQQFTYWADSGTANALVITPTPAVTAYVAGLHFDVKVATANTTTTTINVNGLGVQNIKKFVNSAIGNLEANDLRPGSMASLTYDGTQFILESTSAAGITTANATLVNTNIGTLTSGPTSNANALHTHTNINSVFLVAGFANSGTTENSVFTQSITAGLLSANGLIEIRIPLIASLQNAVSTETVRLKLGGATLATATISHPAIGGGSGLNSVGELIAYIGNNSAFNSQNVSLAVGLSANGTIASSAVWATGNSVNAVSSVDTSITQTLEVTFQSSTTSALLTSLKGVIKLIK